HHDTVAHEGPADRAQAMIDGVATAIGATTLDVKARGGRAPASARGGAAGEHDGDFAAAGELAGSVLVETRIVARHDHQNHRVHRCKYHAPAADRVNGQVDARITFCCHYVEPGYTGEVGSFERDTGRG